jgi:hypothetical protein
MHERDVNEFWWIILCLAYHCWIAGCKLTEFWAMHFIRSLGKVKKWHYGLEKLVCLMVDCLHFLLVGPWKLLHNAEVWDRNFLLLGMAWYCWACFLVVFADLDKVIISFFMPVCLSPSAWNNSAPTEWIFMKFDIFYFLKTLSWKFKFIKISRE